MSDKVPFRNLPFLVQLACFLSLLLAWILFEEIVIDRNGLDRFLPLYRVGAFCVYDAVVLAALVAAWMWAVRKR